MFSSLVRQPGADRQPEPLRRVAAPFRPQSGPHVGQSPGGLRGTAAGPPEGQEGGARETSLRRLPRGREVGD